MASNNAFLIAYDRLGNRFRADFSISRFSFNHDLLLDSVQLKYGNAHRPVRVTKKTASFDIEWSQQRYSEMELFSETIRDHWIFCLDAITAPYMEFHFPAEDISLKGLIEQVERGDTRFTNKYVRTYVMSTQGDRDTQPSTVRDVEFSNGKRRPGPDLSIRAIDDQDWAYGS